MLQVQAKGLYRVSKGTVGAVTTHIELRLVHGFAPGGHVGSIKVGIPEVDPRPTTSVEHSHPGWRLRDLRRR